MDTIPDIRDIKDVIWVFDPIMALALILIVAAIAVAFYYALIRKRNKQKNSSSEGGHKGANDVQQEPYWIIARKKIERLDEVDFFNKKLFKDFYTELTDIIRWFLSQRYIIDTYDKTSSEIIELVGIKERDFEKVKFLDDYLRVCDLVKFARYIPSLAEMKEIKEKSIRITGEFTGNEIR